MRLSRLLVAVALGGCAVSGASEPAAPPVATAASPLVSRLPPPRKNLLVTRTQCQPDELCPVDPPFPKINDVYFDPSGRPCIAGLDRNGCFEEDGWHLATPGNGAQRAMPATGGNFGPAPCGAQGSGWVVPLGTGTLYWQPNGERRLLTGGECRMLAPIPLEPLDDKSANTGIVAREPNDVWVWTPRFISHFDGARWERSMMTAACSRDGLDASIVAGDGSIWFVRGEEQSRSLVRFDPRTGLATGTAVAPALGLALVAGKVTATDFDDTQKVFRQRVFEADGREIANAPTEKPFLRAGFEDGSSFVAPSGLFTEVVRIGSGNAASATIAIPSPAHGFYAPTSREVWMGGEKLYRWRDGMMSEVAYRPEPKRWVVELIAGSGPTDVWVASRPASNGAGPVHLSHWDGKIWRQEPLGPSTKRAAALAVSSPTDAWLTTDDSLFRWNGASWSVAGHFPSGRGISLALTHEAVFLLGNDTIYRRSR
jgi:hypothetical protein